MKRLLIREASSPANDYKEYEQLGSWYGITSAGLSEEGFNEARSIPFVIEKFHPEYIDIKTAATSTARYSIQTVREAGLEPVMYPRLNNPLAAREFVWVIQNSVMNREITDDVRRVIREILANPPDERLFVISGYMIAGFTSELGIQFDGNFIPEPTEMREVDF